MGRVNTPKLTASARIELENGLKTSNNHAFRKRCQTVLLKSDGRHSIDVGKIVGMSNVSVNSWLKRYKAEGIEGLLTKSGRGRKSIIRKVEDQEAILASIKLNRQRISHAKAEWESQREEASTPVGIDTFRNFLKVLADDINASEKE